ncbi:phenazine biosynthesis protein PhzF family [Halopenitus malekzadehii]|uniref:Phenazine biosynthesis protein PhzF family n=1 Tax=Halopenitus malekzadehii TaxID=1267564 RepID=A0A1H6HXY9_9EURY|nr:PhzF family phenazine biosynthesis protein [Halopenitus malekzadehii]SEH39026.1 phenazine biosynthesis protein PhzF family [Halopenitus malekzadehii]
METRRALLVDAFTAEPFTGNAAGVVPDATDLSDDQAQAIAAELGVSETAFLSEPTDPEADRRIRYFTPTQEIDLCGHATVASHAHLFEAGTIEAGSHHLETNVGVLPIEVTNDGVVRMTQSTPTVEPVEVTYDRVGETIGIDPAALTDVGADLPIARASTGVTFLMVPVNFLERLLEADPSMAAIETLTDDLDVAGIFAFTFDTVAADATIHARAWVPGVGVPEDPVTGTASGACGAYLHRQAAFDGDPPAEIVVEQGHVLDRPGRVRVRVRDAETDADTSVSIAGRAAQALDGEIVVPEPDDDDILEA